MKSLSLCRTCTGLALAVLFLSGLSVLPGCQTASPAPQASPAASASALSSSPIPSAEPVGDPGSALPAPSLEELQRRFAEERFGMFIHFGILTYTGKWAEANLDISKFNPDRLDCGQWADAAKAAGMTFGVLTTRHHDGFALWPTATSDFSVKSIPWRNGKGDVVREYVDAFRSRGLKPGLYYSVWDTTAKIGAGRLSGRQIAQVRAQLKELLANYGPIPILVLDGYSWKMGHQALEWGELREYVRSLQPDCLVVDHTHIQSPWQSDLAVFEEPRGVFSPPGNTMAACQGNKIIEGNDWFWGDNSEWSAPLSARNIVEQHLELLEPRYTSFILNCPPDRHGLMAPKIVEVLKEVGETWTPDLSRPPLPAQGPQIGHYVKIRKATADSGKAMSAIDGVNDSYFYSVWESDKALPQSLTLDLGEVTEGIDILAWVPKYKTVETATESGAITHARLYGSTDNEHWNLLTEARGPVSTAMKTVPFAPARLRYLKMEVLSANGGYAAVTEISVGRQ